jgi:hypothetical protein
LPMSLTPSCFTAWLISYSVNYAGHVIPVNGGRKSRFRGWARIEEG